MKFSQLLCASIIFPTLLLGAPVQLITVVKRQNNASFSEKLDCVFLIGPIDCLNAKRDADNAAETARSLAESGYFSSASLSNGKGDAFRHCYWNALMTIRFGEEQAKKIADSHETNGQNPPAESKMDLFNNAKGREIGRLNSSSIYATSNAQAACLEGAQRGTLQIISNN